MHLLFGRCVKLWNIVRSNRFWWFGLQHFRVLSWKLLALIIKCGCDIFIQSYSLLDNAPSSDFNFRFSCKINDAIPLIHKPQVNQFSDRVSNYLKSNRWIECDYLLLFLFIIIYGLYYIYSTYLCIYGMGDFHISCKKALHHHRYRAFRIFVLIYLCIEKTWHFCQCPGNFFKPLILLM